MQTQKPLRHGNSIPVIAKQSASVLHAALLTLLPPHSPKSSQVSPKVHGMWSSHEMPGYERVGEPSLCSPFCGDGIVISPEECDDGNNDDSDFCLSTCEVNRAIPTLNTWGIVVMAILIVAVATFMMHRQSTLSVNN